MIGDDSAPRVRLVLPAVRESLPLIHRVLATLVAAQPLGPRRQEQVLMALRAAVADAVRHADRDGQHPREVIVEGGVRGALLVITVIEDGPGIVPQLGSGDVPSGLALIGAVADRLELGGARSGRAATRMSFALTGPRAEV